MKFSRLLPLLLLLLLIRAEAKPVLLSEDFSKPDFPGWKVRDGKWELKDGQATAAGAGFASLRNEATLPQDIEISAHVAYVSDTPHTGAGMAFRLAEDNSGYAVNLREVEKDLTTPDGPWERPVVQLFRMEAGGWKLLQESKVQGCRSGIPRRLKAVCQGPNIFVYYEDMSQPVLREFDDKFVREGHVAIWKDNSGSGLFDDVTVSIPTETLEPASRLDWSWVRGAVYVRSNAVNAVQMWEDYWDHTAMLDRELGYAADYGFNLVQVYLHWTVWDRHQSEYLKRIDDFLTRAAGHGLKTNFIFWDDCGSVEPSLTFAAPVPGRHNSQMMPNPSMKIRNSPQELGAHRDRFRQYVEGIAGRFKKDPRISFWQIYNECMGSREDYRRGVTDANLNRLLAWTHDWVKGVDPTKPVTATGGGFYGPQYSDFPTYHSYSAGNSALPNGDGGPEHLCTETLNRPAAGLKRCLSDLAGKQNGFVVWELMIGRDNCRFPWGHADGADEPAVPFHGVIYPDGHPWDVGEIKALLGEEKFGALQKRSFKVDYFDAEFGTKKKESISPCIDFNLGDEPGTGSPDASAGLGKDHFSIRWTGSLEVKVGGKYRFVFESDGKSVLKIDGQTVHADEALDLKSGEHELVAEYVHDEGVSKCQLKWQKAGGELEVLRLR